MSETLFASCENISERAKAIEKHRVDVLLGRIILRSLKTKQVVDWLEKFNRIYYLEITNRNEPSILFVLQLK